MPQEELDLMGIEAHKEIGVLLDLLEIGVLPDPKEILELPVCILYSVYCIVSNI